MKAIATPSGFLRDGVIVATTGDMVGITHAHWQVSVPRAFVAAHPPLEQLLARGRSRVELPPHREYDGLVTLLDAQGCFTSAEHKSSYRLRELRGLFDPLRSMWYASYYSHPLWSRLRSGTATPNELVAWVIHNYHVSRAAGVVGARLAATAPNPDWREFFRKDTLEEYWHCDSFYFVRHPELHVDDEDVKRYVPLASSFSFETHTLQVANRHPLSHLLIAYFQESSIAFYDDCLGFYENVESEYGILGFFDTWEKHMKLDQDHGHAVGLAGLFESDEEVPVAALHDALRDAWLAYWYLCQALNDIQDETLPNSQIRLRPPISDGRLDPTSSSLEDRCVAGAWTGRTLLQLGEWVTAVRPASHVITPLNRMDVSIVWSALVDGAYEALSRARDHNDILLLGHLCRSMGDSVHDFGDGRRFESPWAVAIASVVREAAASPREFTLLAWIIGTACDVAPSSATEADTLAGPWVRRAADFLSATPITPGEADRALTRVLQLCELIDRWLTRLDRFNPSEIMF